MKKMTIRPDGSLALSAFALRHLGALPGDEIELVASPLGELRLRRVSSAVNAMPVSARENPQR